jgi:hypothetical protein
MNGRDTPGPRDLLLLAAGCGLVAGLLESTSQFIRHACCDGMLPLGWFTLWMPAVANAAFFLLAGAVLVLLAAVRPGLVTLPRGTTRVPLPHGCGGPPGPRCHALRLYRGPPGARLCRAGVTPAGSAAGRRAPMGAPGSAARGGGHRPARPRGSRAGTGCGSAARWPRCRWPAPAHPTSCCWVLDTARRLNVSAYGYARPTTPGLVALAARGARFDNAISTAPWTLPGHAGIFTGRWAHELSASWTIPLDDSTPTLAEALSARGYRTAGIVANVSYAGRSVGLGRGFAHFEDVPVSVTQVARSAAWTSWLTSRHWVKPLLAPYYKGLPPEDRGGGQRGAARVARPGAGPAVLRVPQLLRRPRSLSPGGAVRYGLRDPGLSPAPSQPPRRRPPGRPAAGGARLRPGAGHPGPGDQPAAGQPGGAGGAGSGRWSS